MVSLVSGFWKLQWSITGIGECDSSNMVFFSLERAWRWKGNFVLSIILNWMGFCIEGMAKFILDVEFSMYRRNECHVERGCGSLYPLGGTT